MITIRVESEEDKLMPEWVTIANEREKPKDYLELGSDDEQIYFYVDDSINLDDIKVGDKIQLDVLATVLEIDGV